LAPLRAEKIVDFPTLGSPTIPQFKAMGQYSRKAAGVLMMNLSEDLF
jgi:hypothetical protein